MSDQAADIAPGRQHVSIVEDDAEVARVIVRVLTEFGFEVDVTASGREFLRSRSSNPPDLCIVDLGLPDVDGMTLVRKLREQSTCAIIIITGRNEVADRVLGLEQGADDYIAKPFEPRELVARVRSVLRRAERLASTRNDKQAARFAGWTFLHASYALISADGQSQQIGSAEAELLIAFLRNPNRILSRDELLPDRQTAPFDRSIDARISRLRKRPGERPHDQRLIKTVYGAGYLFAVPVRWDQG